VSGAYSSLVQPRHPAVTRLVEEAAVPRTAGARAPTYALVDRVSAVLSSLRYLDQSGLAVPDPGELLARKAGNCLALACLACALLRAHGVDHDDVFVAIAAPRGFAPTEAHATVLVRSTGGDPDEEFLLIDPAHNSTAKPTDIERFCAAQRVFVFFNDVVQLSDPTGRRLLRAAQPRP
jgi:hypothetical protein